MRIDLHSHSALSDGTDAPAEVVRRAKRMGLDVVALSDHDHAKGWDEARDAAAEVGIGFVPAIEVSVTHGGKGVHLLAYLVDPTHPGLAQAMERTIVGRDERLDAWMARGESAGIAIDRARVLAKAGRSFSVSKNHIAEVLVEDGVRVSRQEVFDDLLADGKPLFVKRYALALEHAIGLIRDAGGVPILAHPWGRGRDTVLPGDELARLAGLGLAGWEVDHQEHDAAARAALSNLAAELDLIATGSSDYHGTNKKNHELGCNTTAPGQFERLLAAAAAQRAEVGWGTEASL